MNLFISSLPLVGGFTMNRFHPIKLYKYFWFFIFILLSFVIYEANNFTVQITVILLSISAVMYPYFYKKSKELGAYASWFSVFVAALAVAATSSDVVRLLLNSIIVILIFIATNHNRYLIKSDSNDIDDIIPDSNATDLKEINQILTVHRQNILNNMGFVKTNKEKIETNKNTIGKNKTNIAANKNKLTTTTVLVNKNKNNILTNNTKIAANLVKINKNSNKIATLTEKFENSEMAAIKSWAKNKFVWAGDPPPDSDGYYIKTFNITDPRQIEFRGKTQLRVATSWGDRTPNYDNNDSLIVTSRTNTGFLGFQFLKQTKDSKDLPK